MKKFLLSAIALCLGAALIFSCNKNDKTFVRQCESDFILENDSCVCPLGKYLLHGGDYCMDLRENQWAAELDTVAFWANLIIVEFPFKSDHYPVGAWVNTDQRFGAHSPVGYYQYPLENGVDSFEMSFMSFGIDSALSYSKDPEGYYWIVGKKQGNDRIFDAKLQTRKEYGVVTSSIPLNFHK